MSKIVKKMKIMQPGGTLSDYVPIGAEAENINVDGESVETKLGKKPYYYDTVADMRADTKLKAGDMAVTLGYYETNDGGGAEYKVTNEQLTPDNGLIIELSNGLYAKLIQDKDINVKQFGIKGDGSTDDSSKINTLLTNFSNVYFPNGTYKCNNRIILNNKSHLIIKGDNAKLIFTGYASENVGNNGFLHFTNCNNITIEGITVDGNIEWIERPYSWETGYSNYNTLRNKTYDGFNFSNCNYLKIDKCKATKIKVGFHFLSSSNVNLNNSESTYTMADGVLIHSNCYKIKVFNHYVNYGNDDSFSIVNEVSTGLNSKYCSFTNCTSVDSYGSIITLQGNEYCYANNCIGIGNKDTPFKIGAFGNNDIQTPVSKNSYIDNCNVYTNKMIGGNSNSESVAQNNNAISFCATNYACINQNIEVRNSIFIADNGYNNKLYNPSQSGFTFMNCKFLGYALQYSTANAKSDFINCEIESRDQTVFTNSSDILFRNCKITNDNTYTAVGTRVLAFNGCTDITVDNCELFGGTNADGNKLSIYNNSLQGDYYIDIKDDSVVLTNVLNVKKKGVFNITKDSLYGYQNFALGQLVYWTNNNYMYVRGSNDWIRLDQ